MKKIRVLKIWKPDSQRVARRFFMKSEIIFGADKAVDLHIHNLEGIVARLDFESEEIHYIQEAQTKEAKEGDLFQVGDQVFQWMFFEPLKESSRKALLWGGLGLALVLGASLFQTSGKVCTSRGEIILGGRLSELPELKALERSFKSALRSELWPKARAELNAMTEILVNDQEYEACGFSEVVKSWEVNLSRQLVKYFLSSKDSLSAAREVARLKRFTSAATVGTLEKRMRRIANKIYLSGYRLEEDDPSKAEDLMHEARQICLELQDIEDCYRAQARVENSSSEAQKGPSQKEVDPE